MEAGKLYRTSGNSSNGRAAAVRVRSLWHRINSLINGEGGKDGDPKPRAISDVLLLGTRQFQKVHAVTEEVGKGAERAGRGSV